MQGSYLGPEFTDEEIETDILTSIDDFADIDWM